MDTKTRILIVLAVIIGAIGLYFNINSSTRSVKSNNSQMPLKEQNIPKVKSQNF